MILKDVVEAYNAVKAQIETARNFYDKAKGVVDFYKEQYGKTSQTFYASKNASSKDKLARDMDVLTQNIFDKVGQLNSSCGELYQCVYCLSNINTEIPLLAEEIKSFIEVSRDATDDVCKIIEEKIEVARNDGMFATLISHLEKFIAIHDTIISLDSHICDFEKLLFEPVPEGIEGNEKYTEIFINSLVPSRGFEEIFISIKSFGSLHDNIARLLDTPISEHYYIRKIETGSLLICVTTLVPVAVGIAHLVDFCFKKYIEYKKENLNIQSMKRQMLKDDIDLIKETLKLKTDVEGQDELIEKVVSEVFNYFKTNPKFKIGEKEYDASQETSLLESDEEDT